MKTTHATFISEKNKSSNRPVWLYTIYNYDGASHDLNYAEWDADITFNSVTYTKFPIRHDFVSSNTSGQIDTIRITLGNVSRLIQAYLEFYDLRGKKVRVQAVFADQLATATACISDIFYIDSYSADENNVSFSLSSKFDILNINLPSRRYLRNYCSWEFKSTECGYSGSTASCKKTEAECKAMNGGSNFERFGAFPSVPTERVYVG
jgi:lambda family phage minor tail protein L